MSRTTKDLIAELQESAKGKFIAAPVIGFDEGSKFVWSDDPDGLTTLDNYVTQGGEPVGIMFAEQDTPGALEFTARPLAEYEGEEWVEKYLITLMARLRRLAEQQPGLFDHEGG